MSCLLHKSETGEEKKPHWRTPETESIGSMPFISISIPVCSSLVYGCRSSSIFGKLGTPHSIYFLLSMASCTIAFSLQFLHPCCVFTTIPPSLLCFHYNLPALVAFSLQFRQHLILYNIWLRPVDTVLKWIILVGNHSPHNPIEA